MIFKDDDKDVVKCLRTALVREPRRRRERRANRQGATKMQGEDSVSDRREAFGGGPTIEAFAGDPVRDRRHSYPQGAVAMTGLRLQQRRRRLQA